MYPKYLYRREDGERFTLQNDGKYTMDSSEMHKPYRYTYERLVHNYCCVDSLDKCEKVDYSKINNNDGHGNGDFDE